MNGDPLARLAALWRGARRPLVITGAGVSADSGLPTYRGVGGLYNDRDTEEGVPIEVALSGAMLRERPELCWRHIRRIEEACRGARPNRAHEVLAELERRVPELWLLTQNVDGFHRAAGSRQVIDLHGDIHALCCTACAWRDRVDSYAELADVPPCPDCGAPLRPDVVLFGELLPIDKLARLEQVLAAGVDLVLSIGTTSVFPYIAGPVVQAARAGVPTVEINPGTTEVSRLVELKISAGAAATLDDLWRRLDAG